MAADGAACNALLCFKRLSNKFEREREKKKERKKKRDLQSFPGLIIESITLPRFAFFVHVCLCRRAFGNNDFEEDYSLEKSFGHICLPIGRQKVRSINFVKRSKNKSVNLINRFIS